MHKKSLFITVLVLALVIPAAVAIFAQETSPSAEDANQVPSG